MTYEPPTCPDAGPPYVNVNLPYVRVEGPVRGHVVCQHICHRCGTKSSVFWHPFAYGCGMDEKGRGDGGYYFELCDKCSLSFAEWLAGKCTCCKTNVDIKEPWDP